MVSRRFRDQAVNDRISSMCLLSLLKRGIFYSPPNFRLLLSQALKEPGGSDPTTDMRMAMFLWRLAS